MFNSLREVEQNKVFFKMCIDDIKASAYIIGKAIHSYVSTPQHSATLLRIRFPC